MCLFTRPFTQYQEAFASFFVMVFAYQYAFLKITNAIQYNLTTLLLLLKLLHYFSSDSIVNTIVSVDN